MSLSEKDLKILIKLSGNKIDKSFSPNTLSSAYVLMYCKFKSIKSQLKTIASNFQVSAMSVYRCMKYLQECDFNLILTDLCPTNSTYGTIKLDYLAHSNHLILTVLITNMVKE